MNFVDVDWVGVTPENGRTLVLAVVSVAIVLLASRAWRTLSGLLLPQYSPLATP